MALHAITACVLLSYLCNRKPIVTHMKQRIFFLLLSLFAFSGQILAQTSITGTVKDETGEPVIGASVIVTGTSNGAITDLDGNFSMKANKNDELTISYVGYTTRKIKFDGTSPLNIVLKEDNKVIDEV